MPPPPELFQTDKGRKYHFGDASRKELDCPPNEYAHFKTVSLHLTRVHYGQSAEELLAPNHLGRPEKVNTFVLPDGRAIEAWFYQVGNERCQAVHRVRYMYEPIFFEGNRVVGIGHDYYRWKIEPEFTGTYPQQ